MHYDKSISVTLLSYSAALRFSELDSGPFTPKIFLVNYEGMKRRKTKTK